MNILLWVLQGLLAALFAIGGGTKMFMFDKVSQDVASTQAFSREIWMLIGVFELLCALALVAPAANQKSAKLMPIAAACLAAEGILFAGLHYSYAEYSPLIITLVLAGLAGSVSYGRLVLKPLSRQVYRDALSRHTDTNTSLT